MNSTRYVYYTVRNFSKVEFLFYRYDRNRARSVKGTSGFKLLAVTLKLLKEKKQLLILPITLFIGAEQAFLFADYNAVSKLCMKLEKISKMRFFIYIILTE